MRSELGTEVLIGLALAATLVVVLVARALFRRASAFSGVDSYFVRMEQTGGLVTGSEVKLNGVPVGRVTQVAFDAQTSRVRVNLTVNDGTPIMRGTLAAVGGIAALGSVTLDLVAPPPGAPLLADGSEIQTDPTPSILTTASDRAPLLLGRVDTLTATANATLSATERLLSDPDGDLRRTLAELSRATASLTRIAESQERRIDRITANAEVLTAALARDSGANADSLAAILRSLANASARADQTLADLEPGLQALVHVAAYRLALRRQRRRYHREPARRFDPLLSLRLDADRSGPARTRLPRKPRPLPAPPRLGRHLLALRRARERATD